MQTTLVLDVLRSLFPKCKTREHENCSATEVTRNDENVLVELCTCQCHVFGYA